MRILFHGLRKFCVLLLLLCPAFAMAGEFDRFAGTYKGEAEFVFEGEVQRRDMSTTIKPTKDGFLLSWTSVSYKSDGRTKEKTYTIEFTQSDRNNLYKSAMKRDVFGKRTPLDPLKGEPFVWARLEGDTLSVYSLLIDETGEYEIQEYHRTLVDGGLELLFMRVANRSTTKEIRTLLVRQ